MAQPPLFRRRDYVKKVKNTFCPRWLLACSPWKYEERRHWEGQDAGDIHGYDKYSSEDERVRVLVGELEHRVPKDRWILDLGCNCGYSLARLKKGGFVNVKGLDISRAAVEYGKRTFGFTDTELIAGSFETVLPKMRERGEKYFAVFSLGATLELVHPSFDIIRAICDITERYVVLIISEWDHRYPRFWEYEFSRQGFLLVKCIRPFDGGTPSGDPKKSISLLLFENMNGRPQEGAG